MAKPVSSRGSDQFVVRFPEGLRDRIKKHADHNGRSMNSEIIERLLASFRDPYDFPQMTRETLNTIVDRLVLLEQYVKKTNPNWKDDPQLQSQPRKHSKAEDKHEDSND